MIEVNVNEGDNNDETSNSDYFNYCVILLIYFLGFFLICVCDFLCIMTNSINRYFIFLAILLIFYVLSL